MIPCKSREAMKSVAATSARYVIWLASLTVVFLCAAKLSRRFLIVEQVSIFWLANALGLLLLITSNCTRWDALAGAITMTLVGDIIATDIVDGNFVDLGITTGSCTQIIIAYNIFMSLAPEVRSSPEATTTMRFCQALWISIAVSCSVSGVIAMLVLKLLVGANAQTVFLTWFLGDAHTMFFVLYSCLSIRSVIHHSLGTFSPSLFAVAKHMTKSIRKNARCMEYSRHQWFSIAEFVVCMLTLIGLAWSLGQHQGFGTSTLTGAFRWITTLALMYPVLGWVVIRFSRTVGVIMYMTFVIVMIGNFKAYNTKTTEETFVYATLEIFVVLDLAALGTSVMGIFYHEKRKMVLEKERLIAALQSAQAEANDAKLEVEARARDATLFSHMSHELKSPLNVILGFAGLLKEKSLDAESQQHLSHITEAGGLLLQLIVDLLDMLRSRAGKLELRTKELDVAEFVDGLCYQIRELGRGRKVGVTWKIDRGIPRVLADSGKIAQLVHNLGSNAIKFTPAGGKVLISLERVDSFEPRGRLEKAGSLRMLDPGSGTPLTKHCKELSCSTCSAHEQREICNVKLSIRDEGIGIPKEKLSSIFQEFERLESAFDATPGTGIGLAIVLELVRLLGGGVHVESSTNPETSGSTFTVSLPLPLAVSDVTKSRLTSPCSQIGYGGALEVSIPSKATPERSSTSKASLQRSSSSQYSDGPVRPLRVLAVEDERLNRRLLLRLLESDGHTVVMACDGAEALQTATEATEAFDIVLLDLFMPIMDGEGFMRTLKKKGRPKSIATAPIYITSADLRESKWDSLVELGISGSLDKPYMIKAFREVFREVALNSPGPVAPYDIVGECSERKGETDV
ncbi:unnamed protein product [Chrysoparadoxa australica]